FLIHFDKIIPNFLKKYNFSKYKKVPLAKIVAARYIDQQKKPDTSIVDLEYPGINFESQNLTG
ncbi:MAG: hypothetical protein WAL93_05260, partial [Desulfobacterales bacterium]